MVKIDANLYQAIFQNCVSDSDVWREIRISLIRVLNLSATFILNNIFSGMWATAPIINTECYIFSKVCLLLLQQI